MLTDYPKYIGFEGHPESFNQPEGAAESFGGYDFVMSGNEYPDASARLNHQFALSNENWNDKEHDHMSELYVRVRDVEPLVRAARAVSAGRTALLLSVGDDARHNAMLALGKATNELEEALSKLADIP